MIRQTITCDICGIERKQANHWFEVYERNGELRIRSLVPCKTPRGVLKHLCGQTCLHRLVDDFLAGTIGGRLPVPHEEERIASDFEFPSAHFEAFAGLEVPFDDFESSARLIPTPAAKLAAVPQPEPIAKPIPKVTERMADPHRIPTVPHAVPAAVSRPVAKPAPASHASTSSEISIGRAVRSSATHAAHTGSGEASPQEPMLSPAAPTAPAISAPPAIPPASVRPASSEPRAMNGGTSGPLGAAASSSTPARLSAPPAATSVPMNEPTQYPPQRRRAQAWERELARERQAGQATDRWPVAAKKQKVF